MYSLNTDKNSAPTAPSITLWSQDNVTDIIVAIDIFSLITTAFRSPAPTARIAPWGG